MILTESRVRALFAEYLPADVRVVFIDRDAYIQNALGHSFIQAQIDLGIYTQENIYTDFLSPVKSFTEWRFTQVCLDLLVDHVDGLDEALAESYLRHIAAHEAHHFTEAHVPTDVVAHVAAEHDCNEYVKNQFPELEEAMMQVWKLSPVYQRVFQRIEGISRARRDAAPSLP